MLKIGLTGGIGSGKSTVSRVFTALEIPVYEADKQARRLMETSTEIKEALINSFGKDAYQNGILNRKYIGRIVFNDETALKLLNSIVHSIVHDDFQSWVLKFENKPYVIEEAAILIESGGAEKMDYIIFVKSNLQTRISRVVQRDNISEEEVRLRINSQLSDSEKEKKADFIIYNEIDSMILPQIVDLHNKLLEIKE